MGMVEKMITRATTLDYTTACSTHEIIATISSQEKPNNHLKRHQLNPKRLFLPKERLEGDASDHILTLSKKRSSCKYCSYLRLKHKKDTFENVSSC